jgi:hypothetical protein
MSTTMNRRAHRNVAMTIMALSLGACFAVFSPPASAQQHQQGKAQGHSRGGGSAVVPRGSSGHAVAPRGGARMVTPHATRTVTPRVMTRTVTPHATRTVTPHGVRTVTPHATRTVTPRGVRTATPHGVRTVTPRGTRTVTRRGVRTVTPRGARVVTAGKLRGAGGTVIHGHNYSVWRGRHRVHYHGHWRTLVALSTLGAIAIGASEYYPYAYISAPEPYCEGLTEDGCQLMWEQVETLEGDVIDQCVAYCPWQ